MDPRNLLVTLQWECRLAVMHGSLAPDDSKQQWRGSELKVTPTTSLQVQGFLRPLFMNDLVFQLICVIDGDADKLIRIIMDRQVAPPFSLPTRHRSM
jgi:hypothetical protein